MKIFNWIHAHQFSRNVHSSSTSPNQDGSGGQTRRSGSPIDKGNAEKKPLLKQEVNVGQSWELEGILTIGTLAIDPLKTINHLQDEEDDHEMNCNGEGKKTPYINDYDHDDRDNESSLQGSNCEVEMCNLGAHKERDSEMKGNKEVDVSQEETVEEKTTKMEKRVTLLDLFLADQLEGKIVREAKAAAADGDDDDYCEHGNVSTTKKTKKMTIFYTKLGGKKAKKLAPNEADHDDRSRRPMKKMQRFVTRMMKKKVHPDMEARPQKKAQGNLNDDVSLGINGLGTNESASLLLIDQGITV